MYWRTGNTESRRVRQRTDIAFDALSMALFAVVTIIILTTYRDYGITWDEDNHIRYGDRLYDYYGSGFDKELFHQAECAYGGSFDLIGAVARRLLPIDTYEAIHIFGAIIGLLGLLGAWKLGRVLFGPPGGFWALLLLTLTPVYYGHMFNNPKDLPLAVGYIWSLYYISVVFLRLPEMKWGPWVKLGVAMGLAMSVRIAGLVLLCYLLLGAGVFLVYRGWAMRSLETTYRLGMRLGSRVLVAAAVAWAVMVAFWPWAMAAPIGRPLASLTMFSNYTVHNRLMPFDGNQIRTTEVPWDYLLHYFGFKLPELVLILAAIGLLGGLVYVVTRIRAQAHLGRNLAYLLLGLACLFPPAYAIHKGSPLYDGLRHFLFLVPVICVLAAGALVKLTELLAARKNLLALALVAAVVVISGRQLVIMRHLHPHQYVWFNSFAGGLPGAHERYDTEYYAGSYREALHQLRDHLWRTERAEYLNATYRLNGCFAREMVRRYLPRNFHKKRRSAHFWLGYTRTNCHLSNLLRPIVVSVERFDTPLVVIRDLREPKIQRRGKK